MRRISLLLALVAALAPFVPTAGGATPPTVKPPRAALDALLDSFVPAVLEGKDLQAGRRLVAGSVRPSSVQTYPAKGTRFHGWTVDYSYPGDVGFDILLQPAKPSLGAWSFHGEAERIGGRWRITNWYPVATFAPPGKRAAVDGPNDLQPVAAGQPESRNLPATWLLAPIALVGGFVLVAGAVGALRLARTRARVRAIERTLSADP